LTKYAILTSKMSDITLREFASLGGKARASKYTREKLQEWGRKGGRPKKKAEK